MMTGGGGGGCDSKIRQQPNFTLSRVKPTDISESNIKSDVMTHFVAQM